MSFNEIFHSDGAGRTVGENVAYKPQLRPDYELTSENAAEIAADLMQQWMDSPPHRAQIMYASYQVIGVGVAVEIGTPSPDTFVEAWGTQQFQ